MNLCHTRIKISFKIIAVRSGNIHVENVVIDITQEELHHKKKQITIESFVTGGRMFKTKGKVI